MHLEINMKTCQLLVIITLGVAASKYFKDYDNLKLPNSILAVKWTQTEALCTRFCESLEIRVHVFFQFSSHLRKVLVGVSSGIVRETTIYRTGFLN